MIDGVPYWDGGLFDNTPVELLLDLLTEEELENLSIFIVNLFATHPIPFAYLAPPQTNARDLFYKRQLSPWQKADRHTRIFWCSEASSARAKVACG